MLTIDPTVRDTSAPLKAMSEGAMSNVIRAIDAIIRALESITGQRPKVGFWMNVERILIAIGVIVLCTLIGVVLAVKILNWAS